MKTFTESERYNYPLDKSSIVLDCGGYEGNFAKTLTEKYGCTVHVFEPVQRFFLGIANRIVQDKLFGRVWAYHAGIGGRTREEKFHVQNDSTGVFGGSDEVETVQIKAIDEVMAGVKGQVDLLKLNIEGMEYEVLHAIITKGLAPRIRDIQVQFHTVVPDFEAQYQAIAAGLQLTHRLTYREPYCWENWERL